MSLKDRIIMDTNLGLVPFDSTEGVDAAKRQAKRASERAQVKRRKAVGEIESRGMEDLGATEARLLEPLQARLSNIFQEKKMLENNLKNPMSKMTVYGAFNQENLNRQLKDYVDRQESALLGLKDEAARLNEKQNIIVSGMESLSNGQRPTAEFMKYLDGMEADAAKRVAETSQSGSPLDRQGFVANREELKAFSDLRAFAESL